MILVNYRSHLMFPFSFFFVKWFIFASHDDAALNEDGKNLHEFMFLSMSKNSWKYLLNYHSELLKKTVAVKKLQKHPQCLYFSTPTINISHATLTFSTLATRYMYAISSSRHLKFHVWTILYVPRMKCILLLSSLAYILIQFVATATANSNDQKTC